MNYLVGELREEENEVRVLQLMHGRRNMLVSVKDIVQMSKEEAKRDEFSHPLTTKIVRDALLSLVERGRVSRHYPPKYPGKPYKMDGWYTNDPCIRCGCCCMISTVPLFYWERVPMKYTEPYGGPGWVSNEDSKYYDREMRRGDHGGCICFDIKTRSCILRGTRSMPYNCRYFIPGDLNSNCRIFRRIGSFPVGPDLDALGPEIVEADNPLHVHVRSHTLSDAMFTRKLKEEKLGKGREKKRRRDRKRERKSLEKKDLNKVLEQKHDGSKSLAPRRMGCPRG